MLSQKSQLSVAELILYTPALFLAIYLSFRNGWRHLEWIYLAALATIRIIGSILSIKAQQSHDTSFITTAAILNGVGLSPLILAMLGFVQRLCTLARKKDLSTKLNWLHVPIMIALPLLIIGVLKLFGEGSTSEKSLGRILAAVGLAQFILVFVAQSVFCVWVSLQLNDMTGADRILAWVVNSMIPLVLIRLTYSVLAFFVTTPATFSPERGSFAVQIVMSVVPENLVAFLGLGTGLLLLRREGDGQRRKGHRNISSDATGAEYEHELIPVTVGGK